MQKDKFCDSSCLNASITRIGKGIVASLTDVATHLLPSIRYKGGIIARVKSNTEGIKVSANDIAKHLNARVGIVCSLNKEEYLRVSPNEIQWITDNVGVFFDVESNTNWLVTL